MSDKWIDKIKSLIGEGKAFDYGNFSLKSSHGYPSSCKPEYIAWKVKVETLIVSLFGSSSPIFASYKIGDSTPVVGYGPEQFATAQSYILGSLTAAIDTLQFEPKLEKNTKTVMSKSNKVFVVHGHDEKMKNQLEIFLTEIGLKSVVLHRKPDEGQTIIEKLEKYSDVGYAFILLTPDDVGYSTSEQNTLDSGSRKEMRARQNVIFEFGYFVGRLGRNRVCCLYKKGVSLPTDVSGMLYKEIIDNVEEVAFGILKDLKTAGYRVNV